MLLGKDAPGNPGQPRQTRPGETVKGKNRSYVKRPNHILRFITRLLLKERRRLRKAEHPVKILHGYAAGAANQVVFAG